MESIAIVRVIKNGWTNFWRNFWLSATATLIMIITLTILTLILLLFNLTTFAVNNIQEKVDISVYFKNEVSEKQILLIRDQIGNLPEVASVEYVSAAEALEQFRQKHINDPLITESLKELTENPLPATVQVKALKLEQYPQIVSELAKESYDPYISKINFEDNRLVIERLTRILNIVKKVGLALAIVFTAMAIFVIFNTIRLTIYNRKEEVEIMKLVGATNWYIRWPFIIESMLYAIVASIVTILLTIPLLQYIVPRINFYLGAGISGSFNRLNILELFILQLLVALLLGIVSSLIAIRRHLRV